MTDKRPILLATDGSPSAASAQREAFELARLMDAPLLAVSVAHVALPAVGYAAYGYADIVAELTRAEHARVQALLAKVKQAAAADGVRCETLEAEGTAAEAICGIATQRDVQMIVVGSHGWGAGKRLLFGSVSTELLHEASCPVLVVRGSGGEVADAEPAAAA